MVELFTENDKISSSENEQFYTVSNLKTFKDRIKQNTNNYQVIHTGMLLSKNTK